MDNTHANGSEDVPAGPLDADREAEARIEDAFRNASDSLDLFGRGLTTLPESIGELRHLRLLQLSTNHLTALPDTIGQLKQLRDLRLYRNSLRTVPECIRRLTELRELYLGRNQLSSVPDWLGELKHLRSLNLDEANLSVAPEWIGELSELEVLSLGLNRLTVVPEFIRRLNRLKILHLENNRLSSLPSWLQNHGALSVLYLHGNPNLGIPPEILGPPYTSVRDDRRNPARAGDVLGYYFRTTAGLARPLNEAKLILLGRGQVGKTCLVDRLIHDRFLPQEKTEGIAITQWPIRLHESEDVRLNVWDFGGQEIMHSTHQFFLTERSLYVLVLNGREGGEDVDVEYWMKLIQSFGGDSPVIIVLNKIHSHPFDLNRRGLREKYPGRIREFVRTDCTDGAGVEELRQVIYRETDRLPNLRDKFPVTWFAIKDRLSNMTENYVPFDRYRELCSELGEANIGAQDTLAGALHCLGIALNYRDDPRLRDTNVLNPRWVTNGIYRILNSEAIERKRGELQISELRDILDGTAYPPAMHEFLVGLMRKFDLCCRFPDPRDDTYLIPELLGKEQPQLGNEFRAPTCLRFQYEYPVWPEGLLPRFIVRTHALSTDQHRWRFGVVLKFEDNYALVKSDPQEKKVIISITGPLEGRRRLLAVIRSDFERIHADIPNLNPIPSVPLAEDPSVAVPYEELRVLESHAIRSVPRVVGNQIVTVDVDKLLNSVELPTERAVRPIRIFISYSHKDDQLRAELDTHLKLFQRVGRIETWHDRRISAGDDFKREIDENLERADLILLLISADFLASEYCYEIEMTRALERETRSEARVVPIIVRDCNWPQSPIARLQVLPRNGTPVRLWPDMDTAWRDVADGIMNIINGFRESSR